MIPLQIQALRRTRLIKNTKLEGLVELYSGGSMGSGQVTPDALEKVFDFSGTRAQDLTIVKNLAELHSYDVYSLRVSLRRLAIQVDDIKSLQLSNEMTESLAEHMSAFTRPLVSRVYGKADVNSRSFHDVMKLFTDPDAAAARQNLLDLAKLLDINLIQIPQFLEDYADVFLSLSFYQKCHDDTDADLGEFVDDLRKLAHNPHLNGNTAAAANVEQTAAKIFDLHKDVANILELFRVRTEDMWQNISSERYRKMSRMVREHQEKIGAILCALSVKLEAWQRSTSPLSSDSVGDRIGFVTREIGFGLDRLSSLDFQDI